MCFVSDDFRIIAMQSIFDECAWLTISAFLLSSMIVFTISVKHFLIMEKNHNTAIMKNLLMSTAVGDIAGSAYEGRTHRTKDYDKVKLFSSRAHFTDDTVLTFACAEAFIDKLDMTMNLWKCANEHRDAGFGSSFKKWFASHHPQPYRSLGNGSAMRCSSAGWLAQTEEDCISMATQTAAPTHNHPEGIKPFGKGFSG